MVFTKIQQTLHFQLLTILIVREVIDKGIGIHSIGTGEDLEIQVGNSSGGEPLFVQIYEGDCNDLTCVTIENVIYTDEGTGVQTVANRQYYVYVSSYTDRSVTYNVSLFCRDICPQIRQPEIIGPNYACEGSSSLTYYTSYIPGWEYKWSFEGDGTIINDKSPEQITLNIRQKEIGQSDRLSVTITDLCGNKIDRDFIIQTATENQCNFMNCANSYLVVSDETLSTDSKGYLFKAINNIAANASVGNNTDLFLEAGKEIEFFEGFVVMEGSTLLAQIKNCFEGQ